MDKDTCKSCAGTGKRHPDFGQLGHCNDCKKPSGEYMVLDAVWNEAWPTYNAELFELNKKYKGTNESFRTNRRLCLSCLIMRLGRPLTIEDFNLELPINDLLVLGLRLGK